MTSKPASANGAQDATVTTGQNEQSALQQAVRLAELGYAVVRVYEMRGDQCSCGNPKCASPGKHPIGGDTIWSRDPEQIKRWWSEWPDAGVGLNLAESGLLDVSSDCADTLLTSRVPHPTVATSAPMPSVAPAVRPHRAFHSMAFMSLPPRWSRRGSQVQGRCQARIFRNAQNQACFRSEHGKGPRRLSSRESRPPRAQGTPRHGRLQL